LVRLEVVAGGGIFPTGTAMDLTPDNKGLLDGRHTIEFRSYFAGPNRLRATATGLVPAELTIEAVGGEPWAGQHRNLPCGPPSRAGRPVASDGRLLSELRPVLAAARTSATRRTW
jgi:beta-galactosidase